jgi:cell filamentation protein
MVDFNTLKGVDGYRAAFPAIFDGMSDTDAKRIVRATHSSVLEGWEPTTADMQSLAADVLRPGRSSMSAQEIADMVADLTAAKSA